MVTDFFFFFFFFIILGSVGPPKILKCVINIKLLYLTNQNNVIKGKLVYHHTSVDVFLLHLAFVRARI